MINGIVSENYIQTANYKQPQSEPNASISAEEKSGADTVSISNEAKYSQLLSLFPKSISVRDIEESLADTKSYVEKQLQSLYSKYGISSKAGYARNPSSI